MKTKPTHPLEVFMDGRLGSGKFTPEEFEAARALIWAAPDMKAELDFEAAWLESVLRLHDGGLAVPKILREQIERRLIALRLPIAKAEDREVK